MGNFRAKLKEKPRKMKQKRKEGQNYDAILRT